MVPINTRIGRAAKLLPSRHGGVYIKAVLSANTMATAADVTATAADVSATAADVRSTKPDDSNSSIQISSRYGDMAHGGTKER